MLPLRILLCCVIWNPIFVLSVPFEGQSTKRQVGPGARSPEAFQGTALYQFFHDPHYRPDVERVLVDDFHFLPLHANTKSTFLGVANTGNDVVITIASNAGNIVLVIPYDHVRAIQSKSITILNQEVYKRFFTWVYIQTEHGQLGKLTQAIADAKHRLRAAATAAKRSHVPLKVWDCRIQMRVSVGVAKFVAPQLMEALKRDLRGVLQITKADADYLTEHMLQDQNGWEIEEVPVPRMPKGDVSMSGIFFERLAIKDLDGRPTAVNRVLLGPQYKIVDGKADPDPTIIKPTFIALHQNAWLLVPRKADKNAPC